MFVITTTVVCMCTDTVHMILFPEFLYVLSGYCCWTHKISIFCFQLIKQIFLLLFRKATYSVNNNDLVVDSKYEKSDGKSATATESTEEFKEISTFRTILPQVRWQYTHTLDETLQLYVNVDAFVDTS